MTLREALRAYYERTDRAFICGLFHTLGISVLLFACFKLADYFISAPLHEHTHFGLLCSAKWLSWTVQGFAFMGAGLTVFFIKQWRMAVAHPHEVDLDEWAKLTEELTNRDIELHKERSRFKQVVDLQMEYVNKHEPDGTLTFVNKALYEAMGYDDWEPLVGRSIYEFLTQEDADRLRILHGRLTPVNPRVYDTQRIEVAGGRLKWVEWQNCGIFDEQGNLHKVLAVGRDITDRYTLESQLLASEDRYRRLFRHMIAGFAVHSIICRMDPESGKELPCDYVFLEVNPAFERMFNFTGRDIIGRTVLEVMPNTEPSLIERFAKVATTGQPDTFKCKFNDINKWFEVTAFSNQPTQFAATFLDITDQNNRTGKRERITD